jgi:hypothetical protein
LQCIVSIRCDPNAKEIFSVEPGIPCVCRYDAESRAGIQ